MAIRLQRIVRRYRPLLGRPALESSSGVVALAGTASGAATTSGALAVTKALAGTASGTATTSGALSVTKALAGTAAGTATTTGALTVVKALAGATTATPTTTGALSVAKPLAGVTTATTTTTGSLSVGGGVLAGSTTARATTSGTLSVTSDSFTQHETRRISFNEFWSPEASPGARHIWGTDAGGNKGYRPDTDVVRGTEPMRKHITVAAQTWSWTHNLGYYPHVQVFNTDLELMQAYIKHVDTNSLQVLHLSNQTGYITLR